MKLEGKIALIPGGPKGIGFEIAKAYAAEGATVVVASRKQENVNEAVAALAEFGKADGIACDISDPAAVKDMVAKIVEKYGEINVFLNSAGIYPNTPFVETSVEEAMAVFTVDLIGPYFTSQAVAQQMLKQGKGGSIIFLTSGQALRGVPLMSHYSAAKGGVVALARCISSELGVAGIRVNTIACGLTTTDTVKDNIPPEFMGMVAENIPLKRLGDPADYNGIAVLLASDEGSYITGTTIPVDGGTAEADAVHM